MPLSTDEMIIKKIKRNVPLLSSSKTVVIQRCTHKIFFVFNMILKLNFLNPVHRQRQRPPVFFYLTR